MPGPEDILAQLGGPTPRKSAKPVQVSGEIETHESPDHPPAGLLSPSDLLACPCCGTLNREFYQEKFTNEPAVVCSCGVKVHLDVNLQGKVCSDNWNRRNLHARANEEVNRWLAIVDMNLRDDEGKIHDEAHYDPYTFGLLMAFFRDLITRKSMLDESVIACPFCGVPDFIDRKDNLQCANLSCSALIPVEYFDCLLQARNPHTFFQEQLKPDIIPDIGPAKGSAKPLESKQESVKPLRKSKRKSTSRKPARVKAAKKKVE